MSEQNDELEEIIDDFVVESREHLADVETQLLAIEEGGANIDSELVNVVFRAVHSVKGAADFLGFSNLARLAHQLENVLNRIRNFDLVPTPDIVDVLLRGADEVCTMLEDVHASNEHDCSSIIQELEQILTAEPAAAATEETAEDTSGSVEIDSGQTDDAGKSVSFQLDKYELEARRQAGLKLYQIELDLYRDYAAKERNLMDLPKDLADLVEMLDSYAEYDLCSSFDQFDAGCPAPFLVLLASTLSEAEIAACWDLPDGTIRSLPYPTPEEDPAAAELETPTQTVSEPAPAAPPAATPAPQPADQPANQPTPAPSPAKTPASADAKGPAKRVEKKPSAKSGGEAEVDTSIRVSVHLLDHLMTLAGELVLGRNQLLQSISTGDTHTLAKVGSRIDQVTTEMQEAIMETRMQPIAGVFNRFPRVVRDLTKKLGKKAQLFIEGGDVELDRTIIEGLSDPLTHLIRNSVDHGIETPEARLAKGKPEQGSVFLRAYHKNGKVNIAVSDDGAGIDSGRLREKAVSSGVMSESDVAKLSETDALRLLFLPGLSTAKEVTSVSGRGVGMDVVKTNFEKLGGVIEIETEPGAGSTFHVKLPLTLAILASLIVENDGERYAIPQVSISELVRIRREEAADRLYEVNGERLLRLRGDLLPIVDLREVLGIYHEGDVGQIEKVESRSDETVHVIVVDTGQLRYGIRVDKMIDSEEIVLKPLGQHLQQCKELAGMTIVGDGRVALILDVAGIAESQQLAAVDDASLGQGIVEQTQLGERSDSYILFENAKDEYFAVTMRNVARLDRVSPDVLAEVGGLDLYHCGGTALPLIKLPRVISAQPSPDLSRYYALVFSHGGREFALLVPRLIDVRQIAVEIDQRKFQESGIAGSFVHDDHMVRLLDLEALAGKALPEQASVPATTTRALPAVSTPSSTTGARSNRVLLAEDSTFFRDQIAANLREQGLDVIECQDGEAAWRSLQEASEPIDLIVTDIEMPGLSGIELAKTIRSYPDYASIPIVALSSLTDEAALEEAKSVGIDEYHVKLNREEFTSIVQNLLARTPVNA